MFSSWKSWLRPRGSIIVSNLADQLINTINDINLALGYKDLIVRQSRPTNKVFVLDFNGDIMASQTKAFSQEITAVLFSHIQGDQVLIRLKSAGGAAHSYGYAASQIDRLKQAGVPVVVAINEVAASGGYMMACVADKIIAAPFAIVGSIGVVSEFPNVYNLLESIGIQYKQYTAGKFKRTVSPLGKITEEGEQKFKEDLNTVYDLFREHVSKYRPGLKMDEVATGEHWQGAKALELGLIDEIKTSDEYLLDHIKTHELIHLDYIGDKKNWLEKMSYNFGQSMISGIVQILTTLTYGR